MKHSDSIQKSRKAASKKPCTTQTRSGPRFNSSAPNAMRTASAICAPSEVETISHVAKVCAGRSEGPGASAQCAKHPRARLSGGHRRHTDECPCPSNTRATQPRYCASDTRAPRARHHCVDFASTRNPHIFSKSPCSPAIAYSPSSSYMVPPCSSTILCCEIADKRHVKLRLRRIFYLAFLCSLDRRSHCQIHVIRARSMIL